MKTAASDQGKTTGKATDSTDGPADLGTFVIRTWTLPRVDRRLYECVVAGWGLGAAARRWGVVVACERKGRQRRRLGQSRLPREAE
jgi:hypothetical protein